MHAYARKKLRGFTMIEMLMVILVISILAGLTFALVGVAGEQADKGKTRRTLEQVANAIEAFKAEYGSYPPVPVYDGAQPMRYEYLAPQGVRGHLNIGGAEDISFKDSLSADGCKVFYVYGVLSFLVPRGNGYGFPGAKMFFESDGYSSNRDLGNLRQWTDMNDLENGEDVPRDLRVLKKVTPYLDGLLPKSWPDWQAREFVRGKPSTSYTNFYVTVRDAWNNELKYESRPPYETYKLWSTGPTGQEKDYMYAGQE